MKYSYLILIAFLFYGCVNPSCGMSATMDDISAVKVAFATLLQYQKTDDVRSLDLFTTNCQITSTLIRGKAQKTFVIPANDFRESIKKQIALKQGNNDNYEDVKYFKEETNVLVTGNIRYADGNEGPFTAVYARENEGVFKIQKLTFTIVIVENPK